MVAYYSQTVSNLRQLLTMLERRYKVKGFHTKLNIKMHIQSMHEGINPPRLLILGFLTSLIIFIQSGSTELTEAQTIIVTISIGIIIWTILWVFADESTKNRYAKNYINIRYNLDLQNLSLINQKILLFNYFKKYHHGTYKDISSQILIFLDKEDKKLYSQIAGNNLGLIGKFISWGGILLGLPATLFGSIIMGFPRQAVAVFETFGNIVLGFFFVGIGFFVALVGFDFFEPKRANKNLREFLYNRRYLLPSKTSAKLEEEKQMKQEDFIPYFNVYFQQKYKIDNQFF